MSHELRTPLNAILGYTELILDDIYGEAPEKSAGVLERVQSNGKHLLGLINDVLDLSKIEAGQLTLSLTDYSMKDVLLQRVQRGRAARHRQEARLQGRTCRPTCRPATATSAGSTQVLLNLVGNAIKFTDTGEVAIKATRHQRLVHGRGARHRPGHFRGRPGQDFRGVPAGRQFGHQEEGRHRARPVDLQAHRRDARRQAVGRIRRSARARCSRSRLPVKVQPQPGQAMKARGTQDQRSQRAAARPAGARRRAAHSREARRGRSDRARAGRGAGTAEGDGRGAARHRKFLGRSEPVFEAILSNAARLCEAKFANLLLYEGDVFRTAAMHGAPPALARMRRRDPVLRPAPGTVLRPAGRGPSGPVHLADIGQGTIDVIRQASIVKLAGVRTYARRPDAQGRRAGRRDRDLPPGGAPVHQEADRAGAGLSPPRPSSRSRTRACSTSCASAPPISPSRWSSRSGDLGGAAASSATRPAIWSRCSSPCWRTRSGSATPSSATFGCCEGDKFRVARSAWRPAQVSRIPRAASR